MSGMADAFIFNVAQSPQNERAAIEKEFGK
jgi:hypothetical protein